MAFVEKRGREQGDWRKSSFSDDDRSEGMKKQRQTQQSFIEPSSQSVQVISVCRHVWYTLTAKKGGLISTKSRTTVIFLVRFFFSFFLASQVVTWKNTALQHRTAF